MSRVAASESRLRHEYTAFGGDHTFTGGLLFYRADSSRTDRRGATPDAEDGIIFRDSQRDVLYGSVFLENKFTFDRLSITPGFRLENVNQDLVSRNFDPATGAFINEGTKDKLDLLGAIDRVQGTEWLRLRHCHSHRGHDAPF